MKRRRVKPRPWYIFGGIAVQSTRCGTVLVDVADLLEITQFNWHVHADKCSYMRAWLDSRRDSPLRGKAIYLHDMLMRASEGEIVDFRNGNGLDCRRENMRICDKSDDCCNRHVTHSNSGFLGVTFDKSHGKWKAQIKYRGAYKFLGYFDDLMEAVAAREVAAANMHGEFASDLNARLLAGCVTWPFSRPRRVQRTGVAGCWRSTEISGPTRTRLMEAKDG